MICAICGKEINGNPTIDHVFPKALYKWNKSSNIRALIQNKSNFVYAHKECNLKKEDSIINPNKLYLDDEKSRLLQTTYKNLLPVISDYETHKEEIYHYQTGKCFCCRKKIKSNAVLRRINPKKKRTWDNACLVCHTCNLENADYLEAKKTWLKP